VLHGRKQECATLDRLLAEVQAGRSRVLVLRGEPGIGKTALLDYLAERAADCRVIRAAGVESEMDLTFAGLHQLCGPLLDGRDRLPAPQATAVATAFGLDTGDPPDRFIVGLAVLGLLAEAAEDGPVVWMVDDAQWLDQASAQMIGFVGRRLLVEPVAILCAARAGVGDDVLAGCPELSVEGLAESDASALLAESVHTPLDAAVREQILTESHGNPLALRELPRTWSAAELAGGFGLLESMPLAGRIEQGYAERLRMLPLETQLLVLVAAAEPLGDPALLHRAAATLALDLSAVDAAEDAGLLHVGARVEFSHPLVRAASYRSAVTNDRHRVHQALAGATDAASDPDRRAWHRARAAPGPDEEVADELVASAGRAQARGGVAAGAAFLTRAAELTPDAQQRVQRALEAAHANVAGGTFDTARALLTAAGDGPLDEAQRARIDLLHAMLAFASSRGNEAIPLLLTAARRLEPLDMNIARETYLDAFSAAMFGARLSTDVGVPDVARAARTALRRTDGQPSAAELLLQGLVTLTDDYDAGVAPCRRALATLTGGTISPAEHLRWLWQGCVIALELWDDETAAFLSHKSVEIARETGTLSELALALSARTPVLVFCGELSAAASTVAETQSVHDATGIRAAPYGALVLAAWRGQDEAANEQISITMREARERGEGVGVAISEYARAVLCNGSGRYEEALDAASSASGHHEVVAENWGLAELAEPAVRTGHRDIAEEAVGRLARKARATGSNWALGIAARSRALLAEGDDAEGSFRAAITHLGRTRIRAELARGHLLYGEWLRRESRRVDSRGQLNHAHELFLEMGMDAFAERARRELVATGERVRKRTPDMRDELTPQEEQIARLARDGLSNPTIAAQLFLSPRTVEWHLHNAFVKLGISSRKGLRQALRADGEVVPA
jgi:DNA-binding CsgD family transcriptional regulator